MCTPQKLSLFAVFGLVAVLCTSQVLSAGDLVGYWKFDGPADKEVIESVNDIKIPVLGVYAKKVPGVSGKAIKLDGYTAHIVVSPSGEERRKVKIPRVSGDFSVEAWIALGAYPWSWCPIVDDHRPVEEGYFCGYFFGIDANGRLMLRIATDGKSEEVVSSRIIPLNAWTHVAGVYALKHGMTVYINGKVVSTKKVRGKFTPARDLPLLIGRSRVKRRPYGTIRPFGTTPEYAFFDGIIDELKIYDSPLSSRDISSSYASNKTDEKPALQKRVLPAGPAGTGKFAAINTTLKYYNAWDALWRIGDNADVVVQFDESPCRFVFWRGTSCIPCWVTENGIWYNNEFNETWENFAQRGCQEPMSDKQCRYSRVRVIESNDARVVVKWRYALVDNWYQFAKVNEYSGWGDWADETYTIYPDMVAVRKDKLLSEEPETPHEWQESIMVMGPGQRPDEVLKLAALTLANMKGETHTYSWEKHTPPKKPKQPKNANIQLINTRSKYRTFVVIRPQDDPWVDVYAGEIHRDVCVFPWWNHWPVSPRPCDGRWAMYADRASHASLTHWHWNPYSKTENSMTKIMLNGMTNRGTDYLVTLAKSWSSPPKLKISGSSFESFGYDPAQRAYIINCKKPGNTLNFELAANKKSPIVNPAFVIKNWGDAGAKLEINGRSIERGKPFRFGHRHTLEGSNLIVWIKYEAAEPVKVSLFPVED